MTPINLTDAQLETTRRAMLLAANEDLGHAITQIDLLATVAPWPHPTHTADARNSIKLVRASLDILDALGWPEAAQPRPEVA